MQVDNVVIVAAKRTPIGSMLGNLSTITAPELAAVAHVAALQQAQLSGQDIDESIMGCVLQAGIGQAPARQAAMRAGITDTAGATTINKMCGSGLQAIIFAINILQLQPERILLAGGMESMSQAPYLLLRARTGYRLGHGEIKDHMFLDGLEDVYMRGELMGCFAETTAQYFHFTREQQDEFATHSLKCALAAIDAGKFHHEIASMNVVNTKGEVTVISQDEGPDSKKLAKINRLKPAFTADGTVTAANSSSIADGAASVILMSETCAKKLGKQPLVKIVAYAHHAQESSWFTTAPIVAIRKVLELASWNVDDVDLFEINEAFAVVTMAAIQELHINRERVNIHGGACALGHPIGASGARILVTLIYALQQQRKTRGVATLCIGGGEALAIAIEVSNVIK